MRKRIIFIILIVIAALALTAAWRYLFSNTAFAEKTRVLYIRENDDKNAVLQMLEKEGLLISKAAFAEMASLLGYWDHIKPGRYEIKKGQSNYSMVRQLRSGAQSPVNLVLRKLRTRQDLAAFIGKQFECGETEVARFLSNADSLRSFGLDSNTVMSAFIPNTYTIFWNAPFPKIFRRLYSESQKFWAANGREEKARSRGLTPVQAYTMASIVEEETNKEEDKGRIASVYLNRIARNMPLQADPTIRFALNDFTIKRVLNKHLTIASPFNTYLNKGLPPGPICTPSAKTIDAVINAQPSDYLYFVARSDFSGFSDFASTYEQHLIFAKKYQLALDSLMKRKAGGGS